MTKMQCQQIERWDGTLSSAEVPIPDCGPTDVVAEVDATGVGLSAVNFTYGQLGDDPANLPRIPGHEIIATVIETGAAVTHCEPGDLVAAYLYLSCDHCDACRNGNQSLCERLDGYVGVDIDGGFAEYVRLPSANTINLPDGIDPLDATIACDALGTPYHVVTERACVEPEDDVLVLGAGGGVGIHLLQLVQHFGGRVTAVDRVAEKLDRCASLGAEHVVNTAERSIDELAQNRNLAFDSIIDFTGDINLIESTLPLLGIRGRLVHMTGFPDRSLTVPYRHILDGEHEIVGSRYCSKGDLRRCAELVADGTIEPIITKVVDLDGLPGLVEDIESGSLVGRGAVVP